MPLPESRAVLASDATETPLTGHIDTSFAPVPGRETASAPNKGYDLTYLGIESGKVCFRTESKSGYANSDTSGAAGDEEFVRRGFKADKLLFEGRTSFDDLTEKSLWPKDAANQVDTVTVKVTSSRASDHYTGTVDYHPGVKTTYAITMCGPAPKLDDKTRYLAVTRLSYDSDQTPSLFVWIVDRGAEPAHDAGGTTGDAAQPETVTDTGTSNAPAGSQDVVATMQSAGHFTKFLELLTQTGVADTLKSGGPYTVFAPTDDAFALLSPEYVKLTLGDPVRSKHLALRHVAAGASPLSRLPVSRNTQIRNLDDYNLNVTNNGEGQPIKVSRAKALPAPLPATNGLVYVLDKVLTP